MAGRPYILAETNWKQVRETRFEVAVLPWAATEAHNYHLPYGTDTIETQRIAGEAARIAWEQGVRVVVLPTVPFGVNTGQLDIPLTINMNPTTQLAVLSDVVQSFERQGIQKLVLLNGHGGNDFRALIRQFQGTSELFICTLNWYSILDARKYFDEPGDHAGEMETSLMLHVAPDLTLPLSEAGSGASRPFSVRAFREGWAWAPRAWLRATSDTGVGNPGAASAEKGARFFEDAVQKIAGFFVELARTPLERLYEGE